MDDLLKLLSQKENFKVLITYLISDLSNCGLILTKWLSNSRGTINSLSLSELFTKLVNLDLSLQPVERVLVMSWNNEHDTFAFRSIKKGLPINKRGILSYVSTSE